MRKRIALTLALACGSVGFGIGVAAYTPARAHDDAAKEWTLVHFAEGTVIVDQRKLGLAECLRVKRKTQRCFGDAKLASAIRANPAPREKDAAKRR